MRKNNTVLKVDNLSIGYPSKRGNTVISEEINFILEQGELVGLVGANGIGKSTLLRTLTNIQSALSGDVLLKSKPIDAYTPIEFARELGVVLTEQIISNNLTVEEVVALGRQPYTNWVGKLSNSDKDIVNKVLEQTDLNGLRHKLCYELSDGQLQIVMIARALAQKTDVIILDEPTTHLDLYHKAKILKLLKQLASEHNKAILFSSHEIDLCIQLCDRMIVMKKDKTVTDTPCKLIASNVFNQLFPQELVSFDENTGNFKIK